MVWFAYVSLHTKHTHQGVTVSDVFAFLDHFSENWGFMSLAPVIGSNILSIAFGRIFDAHTHPSVPTEPHFAWSSHFMNSSKIIDVRAAPSDSHSLCLEGRSCYADSLKLTIAACSLAFVLGVYVSYRDWKKTNDPRSHVVERAGMVEEDWEEV